MGYKSDKQLEFERKFGDKLEELLEMYLEYNPEGKFVNISFYIHDDAENVVGIDAHNEYYGNDMRNPLNLRRVIKE